MEDKPTCPYCGEKDYNWWENSSLQSDGDSTTIQCGSCEKEYKTILYVDASFTSSKIENIKTQQSA